MERALGREGAIAFPPTYLGMEEIFLEEIKKIYQR